MPLPAHIAAGLYVNGLPGLTSTPGTVPGGNGHSEITGVNVTRCEAWYNCVLDPGPGARRPGLQLSNNNPRNFLFVSNIAGGIAIGIVPNRNVTTEIYSDNYGGCEWHVLARAGGASSAFLHVYRGGGATAPYVMAGGWTQRGVIQSAPVAAVAVAAGAAVNISSYAYIAAGSNLAECCMLELNNVGMITATHQYQQVNIG